jgi:hypothetical protein
VILKQVVDSRQKTFELLILRPVIYQEFIFQYKTVRKPVFSGNLDTGKLVGFLWYSKRSQNSVKTKNFVTLIN